MVLLKWVFHEGGMMILIVLLKIIGVAIVGIAPVV